MHILIFVLSQEVCLSIDFFALVWLEWSNMDETHSIMRFMIHGHGLSGSVVRTLSVSNRALLQFIGFIIAHEF